MDTNFGNHSIQGEQARTAVGLIGTNHLVFVVVDGRSPGFRQIFDGARRAGAHIISHPSNRGKGSALKTGFGFILGRFPGQDVVCADSDGQHSVVDILRVAKLADTQTGLRGYPAAMLPWLLTVNGERYEYELNLLLEAKAAGFGIAGVAIATIYLDHNSGSHFRPLADSVRIYAPLLKFLMSSFACFLIDTAAFLALSAATGSVLGAVVGARCLSATANFLINRRLVFKHGRQKPARAAAARYFVLALSLLAATYVLLTALAGAGIADLPAKLLTEAALLAVSYAIQQRFLFAAGHKPDLVPAQARHSLAVNRNK